MHTYAYTITKIISLHTWVTLGTTSPSGPLPWTTGAEWWNAMSCWRNEKSCCWEPHVVVVGRPRPQAPQLLAN